MDADSTPPAQQTAKTPAVAVFDFDDTLTRRDSLLPFLWHVAGPVTFTWNALVLVPTLLRYVIGVMENGLAKERVLGQFLSGRSVKKIRSIAESFASKKISSLLDPEAMNRLHWHRKQGHATVLVSASPELYLRPWAEANGFDAVIGTQLATNDGRFTGRFETPNCYGPEKVRTILSLLKGRHFNVLLTDEQTAAAVLEHAG